MGWISVNDDMPKNKGYFLVKVIERFGSPERNYVEISDCYEVIGKLKFQDYVTHWMPLPEPPKS